MRAAYVYNVPCSQTIIHLCPTRLAMSSSQIFRAFENVKDQAKDALYAIASCLCHQSAKVKINGRTCQYATATSNLFSRSSWVANVVQILKVLGEGGFSFVYLAQDEHSGVSDTTLGYIRC